jgi:hypothetical protein
MKIDRYLNPKRIGFLIKRDAGRLWKDYLITMGAICGFFLLTMVISAKTGGLEPEIHFGFLAVLYFVVGLIFTSAAFKEAHKKLLNHDWLMLPASTIEKFTEKVLLYSVIYTAATLVLYTLFTLLARLVVGVFLGEHFPGFQIFDRAVWNMTGHFIIAQSVFILGAAWFKKNNFIKTILALVIFSIILSTAVSLIAWLVFNDYFRILVRGDFNFNLNMGTDFDYMKLEMLGRKVLNLMRIAYFGLLTPVCWLGAWLKLREVEVKDGV